MSGKISVILGYHDHLPAGAKDDEFEEIYSSRLKPFVTMLNGNPGVPAALHLSGPLLERLKQKKPEFFLLIGDLVTRKQIELLGGGFYEPLLPLLPLTDKIGQIELLTTYIRRHFGKKPQGCYLPFGAWEQSLTGVLSSCGMTYTFLGEDQFRASGIEGEEIRSPWITEDQGKLVAVFPVTGSIGSGESWDSGGRRADSSPASRTGLVTFFPRFTGNNAETAIGNFFEKLVEGMKEKKLEMSLPGKFLKTAGPLKRAYFPSSADSGFMSQIDDGRKFSCLQPRRFLMTYSEANNLYSKMYFTHTLINQLRGDKARKKTAREELWKAQSADAFCRTAGRDIACSTVRKYAYRSLISAERITREKGNFAPSLLTFDFDLDGEAEYLFQDKNVNCYVKAEGASVFELDYLPRGWNYLDTFSPHRSFRRYAFMDRLIDPGVSPEVLESLARGTGNSGRFCGRELYEASVNRQRGMVLLRLAAAAGPFGGIEIEKSYRLEKNVVVVSYTLTNRAETETAFCFASQFDLSFADSEHFSVYAGAVSQGGTALPKNAVSAKGLKTVEVSDTKNNAVVGFSSEEPFDLYLFHITSRAGDFEAYQSSCFFPLFRLGLAPGKSWSTVFRLSVSLEKSSPRKNPDAAAEAVQRERKLSPEEPPKAGA
ncbi:MAG: DUF1926 domain-containing protein [Treponema sp.]|jgi:hypothetical protein|nr:DUF1926 domain-containing protein [Treponema sp.]